MFTGIVEELGTILDIDMESREKGLTIAAGSVLKGTRVGDSVAVNGACLTVTSTHDCSFTAGVMNETLRRTNLGDLSRGDSVNLERSLQPDSRLGGHFVQGHVDGVGTVTEVQQDGIALSIRIQPPSALLRYIVEKGFIAVDGVSLTITDVDDHQFSIGLIPYTQEHVRPGMQKTRGRVNLEVDILAKYVEKLVVH